MPRLRLLLPPLSRLLQLPLHGGFIVEAEPHEGCAKKVSKLSFTTTSANICKPCFSTYPGATSHDMWCNTIISSWVCIPYALQKFSPREQPRHISSAAACSSAGASASATSSEAGSWQWSYAIECQVELVESVSIPPAHTTTHIYIYIYI